MIIWQYAVPRYMNAVLHVNLDGQAWDRKVLTEADIDYNWDRPYESANISLVFYTERLCQARYEVPMAFACKESYQVVRTWAGNQGVQAHTNTQRSFPYFVRPFDPSRDTLYIPTWTFGDFLMSQYERASQPDMIQQIYHHNATSLRSLAVHHTLLREGDWAMTTFDIYFWVEQLLVIVQEPRTQEHIDTAAFLEYEMLPASFVWDFERARFDAVDQASAPAYAWVPATLVEVASGLLQAQCRQLTIRLISVTGTHEMLSCARSIR